GAEGMEAVAMALGFRVEIRSPLKLRLEEEDKRIGELPSERAWVRGFVLHRRRAAVIGPAGSGKTLLAISVAQQLATAGHRTLFTCFNRRLGDHPRVWVGEVEGIDVATFHELCVRLAKEAGVELPPEEAGPRSPYFEHRPPEALAEAATRLGPRYDAIVVDEGQDFREWWWPALLSLQTDPDAGLLYVFADENQNLEGGGLPRGGRVRGGGGGGGGPVLPNLRNTKQMGEFFSVFYKGEKKPIARGPEGEP